MCAAVVWGRGSHALVGRALESLLEEDGGVDSGAVLRLLSLDTGRKGGGIKPAKSAAVRVGPVTDLIGLRGDGSILKLSVQPVAKQGHRYAGVPSLGPAHPGNDHAIWMAGCPEATKTTGQGLALHKLAT